MPDDPKPAEQLALSLSTDPDEIPDLHAYVDRQFDYTARCREAANLYLRRKDRKEHPSGRWDGRGRWFPDTTEWQPCCGHIAQPTASYPYSLMVHCRTLPHVASLKKVLVPDLRDALKHLHESTDPDAIDPQTYATANIDSITLKGSSMFNAYGMVQLAIHEFEVGGPKKRQWAMRFIREGWPGIRPEIVDAILRKQVRMERVGDDITIYYQNHGDVPQNRKGRKRPPEQP